MAVILQRIIMFRCVKKILPAGSRHCRISQQGLSNATAVADQKLNRSVGDPTGVPISTLYRDNGLSSLGLDLPKFLDSVMRMDTVPVFRKLYNETENDGLRHGLNEMESYSKFFNLPSLRVSLPASRMKSLREEMLTADQLPQTRSVIKVMEDVSYMPSIARSKLMEDQSFEQFSEHLAGRVLADKDLKFTDVLTLLQSFHRFHFESLPHTMAASTVIRNMIDEKCLEILPKLTTQEAFVLSDLWFLSACSRLAQYPNQLISIMARSSLSQWPTPAVVRLLLAVTFQRKVSPDLMAEMERLLMPHIMALSDAELAVICAAFFKTQTTPGVDFLDKLISRLLDMEFSGSTNNIAMGLFGKFLTRYALPSMVEPLQRFLTKCRSQISTLGIPSLGHLAGIMERTLQADEDFLFRLCQKLISTMPDIRLKDQSKIAHICSFFNYRPDIDGDDFFLTFLRLSEKSIKLDDVANYPTKLVELLGAFAQMGLFSRTLMNFMAVPAFWKNYMSQPKSLQNTSALLQLHYAVELEYPDCERPVIPPATLDRLLVEYESSTGSINSGITSLYNALQSLLKEDSQSASAAPESVALYPLLPYTEPCLVVRLKDLHAVPLPTGFRAPTGRHLLMAPSDGTCTVVSYHPWWDYTNPLQRLTGLCEMKTRHLRTMGYSVVHINQYDTQDLSFVRKIKYLRDKLFFETANVAVPLDYVSGKDAERRSLKISATSS